MNRILQSHLDGFSREHGLQREDKYKQFEKFCNFSILSSKLASIDLDDVTTSNGDDGIDGIAIIINEESVISKEDAETIFRSQRKNNDVEVVFIQSKTSESFDLGDFLKFKESILRFCNTNEESYTVADSTQKEAHAVFNQVITNVPKVRGGKPDISIYFVTAGNYTKPEALETAKNDMFNRVAELGLFENITIKFFGRTELIQAWSASHNGIEASLDTYSNAALPAIQDVNEAYLAIVKAKDYINNLLINEDGSLRNQLFEENVRHFLGSDNSVNEQIGNTLLDDNEKDRFPFLNNGITIVSPDVQLQGTKLHLRDFQIINGCQTSHVLYENRNNISDNVMVSLKIIETDNEELFGSLVKATNSQSKIEDSQFLSLKPITKRIEAYFNTYEDNEGRLYFERRDRQYSGKEIPAIRIINLQTIARCVCAMFIRRPDLSFKFPRKIYNEFSQEIFKEQNREIIYYASALALYRFNLLCANGAIPTNMRKFKWHILPIIAILISGEIMPELNSKKIEAYAQDIINKFQAHNQEGTSIFQLAIDIIQSVDNPTDDRLKGQVIFEELLSKTKEKVKEIQLSECIATPHPTH